MDARAFSFLRRSGKQADKLKQDHISICHLLRYIHGYCTCHFAFATELGYGSPLSNSRSCADWKDASSCKADDKGRFKVLKIDLPHPSSKNVINKCSSCLYRDGFYKLSVHASSCLQAKMRIFFSWKLSGEQMLPVSSWWQETSKSCHYGEGYDRRRAMLMYRVRSRCNYSFCCLPRWTLCVCSLKDISRLLLLLYFKLGISNDCTRRLGRLFRDEASLLLYFPTKSYEFTSETSGLLLTNDPLGWGHVLSVHWRGSDMQPFYMLNHPD